MSSSSPPGSQAQGLPHSGSPTNVCWALMQRSTSTKCLLQSWSETWLQGVLPTGGQGSCSPISHVMRRQKLRELRVFPKATQPVSGE